MLPKKAYVNGRRERKKVVDIVDQIPHPLITERSNQPEAPMF